MGQVLHGSATTTETVRRAMQHSQACPEPDIGQSSVIEFTAVHGAAEIYEAHILAPESPAMPVA